MAKSLGIMGALSKFAVASAAIWAAAPAQASPWNRADGEIFSATTANYYSASTLDGRYQRIDSDTYIEFGVTPAWMASARVSFGESFSYSTAGSLTAGGLNEATFEIQRQLQRDAHSATALKVAGIRSGSLSLDAQSGAPTPNMEAEIRALHGRDLMVSPFKIFATGEAAYRRRFGGDADQIRADALIGIEPSNSWLFLIEAQTITSLRNEEPGFADFDLYKAQASIVWRKSRRWSVIIGGRGEFAARNTTKGVAAFVGLWSEF